jgi:hypothetical protein
MSLSKRERLLGYGVGGVLGLLALDYLVLTPFLNQRSALEDMQASDARERIEAANVRRQERALKAQWADRRSQGLASDSREAERQLLKAIKDWASESDLTLASVKPEYIESKKELREMQVQASGSGSHVSVVKFLYKLQTAHFPVRVTEVQVTSRTDSGDLALQLRISTLYLVDEAKSKGKDEKKDDKKALSALSDAAVHEKRARL